MPGDGLAEVVAGKVGVATLLLPSLRSAPLDSPELGRVTPRPPPRRQPALLAWSVPVVAFDPAAVPEALDAVEAPDQPWRNGASIRFLAGVARLARDLVGRGRVIPTLDHDPVSGCAPTSSTG